MRGHISVLAFLLSIYSCNLAPAAVLHSTVQELGDDLFRIQYEMFEIDFLQHQEIEIQFDPGIYLSLANPQAPDGFDVIVFQPNDPFGSVGRLSALVLVDHAALDGPFSVDVRYIQSQTQRAIGSGVAAQDFLVNQLDEHGVIVSIIAAGTTSTAVPEPATIDFIAIAALVACALPACCRRLRKQTGSHG